MRNTFGLAFDPVTGDLWDTENGPNEYDEVNRIVPSFNSGWRRIMGPDSRDNQDPGDLVHLTGSTYHDPEFSWNTPVGVTAIAFLADTALGEAYQDALLVGDVNTGQLYLFHLDNARDALTFASSDLTDLVADDGDEIDELIFGQGFGIVTDLVRGPDGAIYIASYTNSEIYRLVPEPTNVVAMMIAGPLLLYRPARRRRR